MLGAITFDSLTLSSPAGAASSATLSVNIALGGARVNGADQFTVAVAAGSIQGPVVNDTSASTTSGSGGAVSGGTGTTGIVNANAGSAYFVSESATDGPNVLSTYSEAISCTDANGLQSGLPTGAPFSGPLAITPVAGAAITCVITNVPHTPTSIPSPDSPTPGPNSASTLTVTAAFNGPRVASSDQFTVAIHSGGADGAVVNSTNSSTTAGSGAVVFPGTGTTGAIGISPASTYTMTETAAGGTNLADFSRTVTCNDTIGLQTALPDGTPFNGALAISVVSGADVTCTITASAIGTSSGTASSQSNTLLAPHASPKTIVCTVSTAWLAQTGGGPTTLYGQVFGAGSTTFANLGQTPTSYNACSPKIQMTATSMACRSTAVCSKSIRQMGVSSNPPHGLVAL